MAEAPRDQNFVPSILLESSSSPGTVITAKGDQVTGRLLVDMAGGGSGTVTEIIIASANGFAGTSDDDPATPTLTLSTTVTGLVKGNGTAMSAAVAGTDYTNEAFKTISVSGQSDIVADGPADTLTLAAGANITITTDAGTDTITIASSGGASGITIGTTTITSGTNTRILYNNAGVVGEYTLTGSGTVVAMATAPTFVTSITTPSVLATANDSGALGASGTAFSDLFLASGGVINWNAGNATITHSAGLLTVNVPVTSSGLMTATGFEPTATTATGNRVYLPAANTIGISTNGTGRVQFNGTTMAPVTNDGFALGSTSLNWSDLFLASGAVINYANSNVVITHSSGILTMGTGEMRITTPGTDTASVVTVGGTQTLTNKTLTSPVIGTIASNTLTLGTGTFTTLTFDAGASDPVITAASGSLTVSTGDFRVTTAGTNTASVVTVDGTQTLGNKTLTSPAINFPTNTYTVEPSVDDTKGGDVIAGILAGDTIAQWDLVYLDATSGRWELADADAAGTAGSVLLGLATAAGTDGGALTVLVKGIVRNDGWTWATVGGPLYPSTTAAAMSQTAASGTDDVNRVLGYALSDDCVWFDPAKTWITRT